MRYAKDNVEVITWPSDCPYCDKDDKGKQTVVDRRIAPEAMKKHLAEHAYKQLRDEHTGKMTTKYIGANCDCPRIERSYKRRCPFCKGKGNLQNSIRVGQFVRVKQGRFTDDEAAGMGLDLNRPGKVLAINDQIPEWDGDMVSVSWDLTMNNQVKKDHESWAFQLDELLPIA